MPKAPFPEGGPGFFNSHKSHPLQNRTRDSRATVRKALTLPLGCQGNDFLSRHDDFLCTELGQWSKEESTDYNPERWFYVHFHFAPVDLTALFRFGEVPWKKEDFESRNAIME
jgi:hypothetical protein